MYCSVKFLSPIVTAGLPLPGCPDGAELALVLDSFLSLDPQAATAAASTSAITTLVSVRTLIQLIRLPPSSAGSSCVDNRSNRGRRPAQPRGCHEPLNQGEHALHQQRE